MASDLAQLILIPAASHLAASRSSECKNADTALALGVQRLDRLTTLFLFNLRSNDRPNPPFTYLGADFTRAILIGTHSLVPLFEQGNHLQTGAQGSLRARSLLPLPIFHGVFLNNSTSGPSPETTPPWETLPGAQGSRQHRPPVHRDKQTSPPQ